MKDVKELTGIHKDRSRIYILANGDSINNYDLKLLDNDITIGLNRTYLHYNPTYYLWGDKDIAYELEYVYREKKSIYVMYENAYAKTKHCLAPIPNTQQWIDSIDYMFKSGSMLGNITSMWAIQLATMLNSDAKIYLLGYDFYIKEKKHHFYRSFDHKYNLENHAKKLNNFVKQFERIPKGKHQIFNCNSESNLKIFPFISFEESLKNS